VTWDSSKGLNFGKQGKREDEIGSLEKSKRSCRYLQYKTINSVGNNTNFK
jgi:hypothetical protein